MPTVTVQWTQSLEQTPKKMFQPAAVLLLLATGQEVVMKNLKQ